MNLHIQFRILFPLLLLACGAFASSAYACSLDNRPSLSANGILVIANTHPALNSAQLATYAPFVFPRSFAAGKPISLTENKKEVATSLVPEAMKRPWRWSFGDGAVAYGWTVKHTFARKGNLRVTVDAYFPATKKWYPLDLVQIRIS